MKIKNVKGSSKISKKPPLPYTTWLDYWESKANFKLQEGVKYTCPACGKSFYRKDFDGCHVQKADDKNDISWYIIPLCSSCNQKSNDIFDVDGDLLVPVPSNL